MAETENINNVHFFEGVEKLLEIWFTPNDTNKNADLRKIPRWVVQLLQQQPKPISFEFWCEIFRIPNAIRGCCDMWAGVREIRAIHETRKNCIRKLICMSSSRVCTVQSKRIDDARVHMQ